MSDAVSVVIPTYNRAALVLRALESVLPQCRAGDEVIVVDDGSTDDTEDRLRALGGRIVYVKIPNGGAGRARNAGIDRAGNPLLAFLDSDDEWLPGKLELQRRFLDARPDVLFCFTDMRAAYPDGRVRRRLTRLYAGRDFSGDFLSPKAPYSSSAALPEGVADFPVHVGDLYPEELRHGYVQIGTLMLRRSAVADGALRLPALSFTEDAEFIARLAKAGPAAYLDLELEIFHEHGGARLTDIDSHEFIEARMRFLARVWGADAPFLEKHGASYRAALDDLRLLRVRVLLSEGRSREAREELARAGRAPLAYRALCLLPGSLVAFAARLRAGLRSGR
ncbi:MAG: glycosyltransferase family 2 protein [Elusimicrobia bacterium]|nr:glycosyltransferase family 2 protein [Elusimicrobiota bacterium]